MRTLLRGACAAALITLASWTGLATAADAFESGKHYQQVRKVSTPVDPKRIEVAEFFWYGCPHCYAFDPVVDRWKEKKAADVDFVRYPSTLGHAEGRLHAKAFYTAEELNVFAQMHPAIFAAMHKQRQRLSREDQIAALFNRETGVLPEVFTNAFNGFAVDSRTRKAEQLARDYGLTSVPVVVVGGKYVTSPVLAGGNDNTFKVVDFLVDKIRKERAGK